MQFTERYWGYLQMEAPLLSSDSPQTQLLPYLATKTMSPPPSRPFHVGVQAASPGL